MADRQSASSRSGGSKQVSPRRNDVIRCENCGEEYSVTYKRCPFCDERPGRSGGRTSGGRRVANNTRGGGYGGPVNPIHVIQLVISLVVIIAALVIVIRFVGVPLLGGGGSSSSGNPDTSQGAAGQPDGSDPSGTGDGSQGSAVESITLNRTEELTLQYNETYQLTATVTPSDVQEPVEWTSSDPSILTVDQDGLVQNVNTGTSAQRVVVTASCGGIQAQCEVYCRAQNAGGTGDSGETGGGTQTGGSAASGSQGTIVNAENGLNIRSGPGQEYEVVASAANGATVTILGEENGWYQIRYNNTDTGYVSSDYVSVSG